MTDSGNVYFGDPVFGTLARMDAYCYAENNFYDSNLDESGSTELTINGVMSAGNQIVVDRDHDNGSHTKMTVNFDDRVELGTLELPGLPSSTGGSGIREMEILTVFEIGAN